MNPQLTYQLSLTRIEDLRRETFRQRRGAESVHSELRSRMLRWRLPNISLGMRARGVRCAGS